MKKMKGLAILAMVTAAIFTITGCEQKKAVKVLTVDAAREQVNNYNQQIIQTRDSLRSALRLGSFEYKSEFFTKEDLQALLAQDGCTGIRIYRGLNKEGKSVMLIVGVAADSSDLIPKNALPQADTRQKQTSDSSASSQGGIILFSDVPCPQVCPPSGL